MDIVGHTVPTTGRGASDIRALDLGRESPVDAPPASPEFAWTDPFHVTGIVHADHGAGRDAWMWCGPVSGGFDREHGPSRTDDHVEHTTPR